MELPFVILTLLAVFTVSIYYYCIRKYSYWKRKGVPYATPRFLFGNLLELFFGGSTPGDSVKLLYDKFQSPYFGIFCFTQPILVLRDPEIIKSVLVTDFPIFTNHPGDGDEAVDPIFGKALTGLKDQKWKTLRTKLSPAFSPSKIKAMFILIDECAKNLTNYLSTKDEKIEIEIKRTVSKYVTDAVASCIFGIKSNSFINKDSEVTKAGRDICEKSFSRSFATACYFLAPSLVKPLKLKFIEPLPAMVLKKIFTGVLEERETMKMKRMDFIDILLDIKHKEAAHKDHTIGNDELLSNAITFFAVGQETTTLTISYALHELCLNAKIQNKVRSEIMKAVELHHGLTYEAVQDIKYLDIVLSEVLRKYTLAPILQRQTSKDYIIPQTGLLIEKNTPIFIPVSGLHWDPKYFPNPQQFNPDRFTNEKRHYMTTGSFIPFGLGPRNCIGEKISLVIAKLAIIHVIKEFKVEKTIHDAVSYNKVSPILQPKGDLNMICKKL